jgi:hypothetical protein
MTVTEFMPAGDARQRDAVQRCEMQYVAFRRQRAIYTMVFWVAFAICVVASAITAKFNVLTLVQGLPRTTEFLVKLVPPIQLSTFVEDIGEWYWGIGKWLDSLLNTLLMAYLATVLGTLIGGALSFLAARNLAPNYPTYWLVRRSLEVARTVPDIVWALMFVMAFGIGPLPGVLAITVHSIGAQGKLFAEVNENISPLPTDGIRSAGGNWLESQESTADYSKVLHGEQMLTLHRPLLVEDGVHLVKGFYRRPLRLETAEVDTGGGRVTELLVRPLLAALRPELAGVVQPLGGEYAGTRELLESLPFAAGYGVEIGLLLDTHATRGLYAIAQVNLGVRKHRNRSLLQLGVMARQIRPIPMSLAPSRARGHGRLPRTALAG